METKKILTYITSGLILLLFTGCGLINSKSMQNKAYTAWLQMNSDLPVVNGEETLTPDETVAPINYKGGIGGMTSTVFEEQSPPDVQPVDMQTFRDTLSNYGQWVEINKDDVDPDYIDQGDNTPDESLILSDNQSSVDYVADDNNDINVDINFNYIWVPYSNYECEEWNPYINGRWVWTPCGYQWVSNYRWGYGPYHYGRWWHSRHYGWVWSPGYRWRSSWVRWCVNDGYIGWNPISPREHHHHGWHHGDEYTGYRHPISIDPRWVFVKKRDFTKEINTSTIAPVDIRTNILGNPKTVITPVENSNINTNPVQLSGNIDNIKTNTRSQKQSKQNIDNTRISVLPKSVNENRLGGSTTLPNSKKITSASENGNVTLSKTTDPREVSVRKNNNTKANDNKKVTLSKNDPKDISVNRKNTRVIETDKGILSKKDSRNTQVQGNNTGIVQNRNKTTHPVNEVPENRGSVNKNSGSFKKNNGVTKSYENKNTEPVNRNTEVTKGNQNRTKETSSSDSWNITKSNQTNTQPRSENVTKSYQNNNNQSRSENVTKSHQNNNSSSNYKPYTPPVNNNNSYKMIETKPNVKKDPPPVKQETYNNNNGNKGNSNNWNDSKPKGNNKE